MSDEKMLDFDVSTIANDTYFFYVELGKKCRTDIDRTEKALKDTTMDIGNHEAALVELRKTKEALSRQLELLKTKNVDITNVIGDLEKNKRQFKSIVTGAKTI